MQTKTSRLIFPLDKSREAIFPLFEYLQSSGIRMCPGRVFPQPAESLCGKVTRGSRVQVHVAHGGDLKKKGA